MIYVIMGSHVRRNESVSRWKRNGVAFSAASIASGAAAGAVLGAVGATVSASARIDIAVALALVALVLGVLGLLRQEPRLLQRNCETPQSILKSGALRAAMRNGSILGVGATSRLGFWLWYVVPSGSFLSGSAALGAGLYATYAAVRGAAPWLLIGVFRLIEQRGPTAFEAEPLWLLRQNPIARRATGLLLAVLGATTIAAFGPWIR